MAWVALGLVIAGSVAVRARLLDVPLDRDEGEYAYMAQLLLRGIPPYVGAYSMKMPGIYGVYAGILRFLGDTPAAIHAGLAVANAAAIVLTFVLARGLFGSLAAVTAALTFAALSLSPQVLGHAAYAEQFLLVPALAGVLAMRQGLETRQRTALFAAGVLLGVAVLIKQSGVLFVVFAVVWIALRAWRAPDATARASCAAETRCESGTPDGTAPNPEDPVGGAAKGATHARVRAGCTHATTLIGGAVLPLALVSVAFAAIGSFDRFWFWTVRYASEYGSTVPLTKGLTNLARTGNDLVASAPLVFLAGVAGAMALAADPILRPGRAFAGIFALCSFLAAAAGLYFRHQYFVLALPAIALIAGVAPGAARRRLASRPWPALALAALVLVVPAAHFVWNERFVLLQATPLRVSRTIYGRNPFPESIPIADYLRRHTSDDDTIVVIGSEPQIYFHAGRRAATSYIYMYPLMERHAYAGRMQQEMIRQVEAARPRFLVFVNVYTSWLAGVDSELLLSRWLATYGQHFERVGVVDIVSADLTRYAWDDAARTYTPESQRWLAIWRRRADAP